MTIDKFNLNEKSQELLKNIISQIIDENCVYIYDFITNQENKNYKMRGMQSLLEIRNQAREACDDFKLDLKHCKDFPEIDDINVEQFSKDLDDILLIASILILDIKACCNYISDTSIKSKHSEMIFIALEYLLELKNEVIRHKTDLEYTCTLIQ